MGQLMGDQNQVGFFYESGTYATASGALQWPGLVINHDLKENPNRQSVRYAGTATRNVNMFVDTQTDVEGTLTYHPQDWKMMMFALGSNVDAGSPSPYTHTISELNGNAINAFTSGTKTPFVSFGIEDSKTFSAGLSHIRTAKGCTIDEWNLKWSQNGILECEAAYLAQSVTYTSGAKSALTEDTSQPFVHHQVQLHIPSGTIYDTNEGNFSIKNNLVARHYTNGSVVAAVLKPTNRDYSLEVNMDMESSEAKILYDQYYKGGSVFNAMLAVTASTGSRDMFTALSGCAITDMTIPSAMEGINKYDLTITPKSASVFINDTTIKYNPW